MNGKTALVVGASRTIGLGLVRELVSRGWKVIGTVRGQGRTALHDLADSSDGDVAVETLDMNDQEQLAALRRRLAATQLDLVFVNGAIADDDLPVGEVPTETFVEVMVTNALSPMRVIEVLQDLVPRTGTLGVMSSTQGSISMNTNGGHEVYRASKSALNQLMRSFAARHADDPRTLLLVDPGWVQTDLGGAGAALTVEESVPGVVDTITAHEGEGGLHYVTYQGDTVAW
ncbi:NAD(P)-dependent dehydrogenase, short-chain alcohol dehydrogenase family [Auraticoccus monumenti]|uniref:NAD(P)-dependent dehydrogenase, short-chain alcohol dehydrogenase family n=2 Tax=Auraticoccus monumenti TaxID=675864 RepID=A0A1G7BSF7_9ACTN|nr:NAD(P)-dependent dehydrogenase, short-chain alcohol dehydrogenase family [Auraticoccus monumenti]